MTDIQELFSRPQFSLPQQDKEQALRGLLNDLTRSHQERCQDYRQLLRTLTGKDEAWADADRLEDFPFLPVSLFKRRLLKSIPDDEVFKTMTSSGTTGQEVSRITLDRTTADLQARALSAIVTQVMGPQRMPMIVIDTPNVVKNRNMFSARAAGVLGMIQFGRKHFYALDDDMKLDVDGLSAFLDQYAGQPILLFGFTYMVWEYFYNGLLEAGLTPDLSQGILFHSGGWKKLADKAVDNAEFKRGLGEVTGLRRIHNYYGMVEQVGSVFMEGPDGFLYPPNFADVIIRNPETWEVAAPDELGLIEVISVLPHSYPGHVLLTEDLGRIHGVGDPASGWAGKQLSVIGRLPKAELRGCSDTHAASVEEQGVA